MDIFADFHTRIAKILDAMGTRNTLPAGLDMGRFVVEPPRDASNGDLASNAAMVFAKEAKAGYGSPRAFAVAIAADLVSDPDVASAEVAGPGFINIVLKPSVYLAVLGAAVREGAAFGRHAARLTGEPQRINVEYVSANPTGPLHVGHGRGAVFGDALSNLLAFAGFAVTREYYINDAGAQVDVLARSAFLRYREALGQDIGPIPDGLYPGDYLKPVGTALAVRFGDDLLGQDEAAWLPIVRDAAIAAMMDVIRDDLDAVAIKHDVFFSERSLTTGENVIASAIAWLRDKGLIYEGRLPPPKGQVAEEWEDREQTLFRSTDFGDDTDRALIKSDGSYTYFAADIAYHKSKIDRGFPTLIDVVGADHGGYVKRLQAAVAALSDRRATLDVKLCQLVKLTRNGEPVKMSKRAGDFVTLRDVVAEVGADAVRFMMLFRKNEAALDFDLAKVIEQSKDNPVFYVQYAHARACSVMRLGKGALSAEALDMSSLAHAKLALLTDEGEVGLIKLIAQYPRLIASSALAHEPHRLAFYLYDLASAFHAQWNRGKDHPRTRFINENETDLTCARLALVAALTFVIKSGLGILGVNAPEEMR